MADSIFDLQDNLSAPSQSFYDKFLQDRQQMAVASPTVAAQMPVIGAYTPGQAMYNTTQTQPAAQLANTVSSLPGQPAQVPAQPMGIADTVQQGIDYLAQASAGTGAKPKDIQANRDAIQANLDYTNPLKPVPTIGPNIGKTLGMPDNAGGIMGLGIQPIDVLAFALGAAVTSRLPQDQAMAMTFKIAGLPKAFRDNQEASARKFIDNAREMINTDLAGGNLAQRQLENSLRLQQQVDSLNFVKSLTDRLSKGIPLSEVEKQVYAIQAKRAGIDPNVIKDILIKRDIPSQLADLQSLSQYAQTNNLGQVRGTLQLPGGGTATIGQGGASGRALTTGELVDSLQTGQVTDKMVAAGFTDATSPEGRAKIQAAVAGRQAMEKQRIEISQTNSERAQKSLEQLRPEESKKLEAFSELHRTATDMLDKYNAALSSHGGKQEPALLLAIKGATASPDSWLGSAANAAGQRYPGLTEADRAFISRYASMQKFARGMLNDVGNLSNYERGLVTNMIGTPLDVPAQFRSRTSTAISDVAAAYKQAKSALPARDTSMFPDSLSGASNQGAAPGQPPKGATVWTMENGKLVQRKQP